MFDINKITRPNIQKLQPYSSARNEFGGMAEVYLDANENPFGFGLNRYPDHACAELKKKYASFRKVKSDQLIFGNGSDELIDLIIRSFCEPTKDKILVFTPTFGMYKVNAAVNNVEVIEQSLTLDFQINADELKPRFLDENLKLIFICSPNNPTGNKIDKKTILSISREFDGLVILDEAYADFSDESLIHENLPNLLVLQTFSKAFGMAGIRLGVGIGNPMVIDVLNKVKPPYNVNSLSQEQALAALDRSEEIRKQVQELISERETLAEELSALSNVQKVYPSDANFLLVQFEDASKTYQDLLSKGIVVRDRSSQVTNTLRITVGTPEENRKLISALKKVPFKSQSRRGNLIRSTSETQIRIMVDLDDPTDSLISTGIAFFDHMLEQIARHGGIGLVVEAKGDLSIDPHHTIEDVGLALGSTFNEALGDRKGIERYGFLLPMDDCLAQVAIDFGGRPWLEWSAEFKATHLGDLPTEMVSHFFKSFSDTARCNLNIRAEGENDHHKVESIFKAFARALKMAVRKDDSGLLPSTKGVL